MRISVDPDDPGYQPAHITSDLQVYLDNALVEMCIVADEELGFVLCYEQGTSILKHGEEWPRLTLKGQVKIRHFIKDETITP